MKIKLIEPVHDTTKFKEWQIVKGNSILKENTLVIGTTETIVYAMWKIYSILNIDLDGGSDNTEYNEYNKLGTIIQLEVPTREGYKFTGWTVSGTGAILSGTNLTIGASDVTLTANWLANFTGISIKTPPTKTQYNIGDPFDPTGMVVEAVNGDGTTEIITDYTYTPNGWLTENNKTITISYTKDGITKTTTQAIEVGYIITIQADRYQENDYAYVIINDVMYNSNTSASILVAPGTSIILYAMNTCKLNGVDIDNKTTYVVTSPMSIYMDETPGGTDETNQKGILHAVTSIGFVKVPPYKV